MHKSLRILFAGTPEFSVPTLNQLIDNDYQVIAVYTQPDRSAGRGRKLSSSPVKNAAMQHGLPVEQPLNFKQPATVSKLAAYQADLMVVVAYGLLLPESVLSTPRLGCINIHASLLPRWRGAAPIQHAILAGDKISGIYIMQMEKGLDTGPVYLREKIALQKNETSGSLHNKLSELGATSLLKVLPEIIHANLQAQQQNNTKACYASKLSKSEVWIDWRKPAQLIEQQIRAFNPWPIAQTHYKNTTLRIWCAQAIAADTQGKPGEVLATEREGISVATGKGLLRIEQLQLPGKRAISAQDFMNAYPLQGQQFNTP